jgi:acyl-CoA synthetase (AMP-forming)/AMP-acid ligase II
VSYRIRPGERGGVRPLELDARLRRLRADPRVTLDACRPSRPGFRREAFYPCYGLAEATLFVTGGKKGDARASRIRTETSGTRLVGCGTSGSDHELVCVDPASRRAVADGDVGEIWLAGPSVARGYWQRPRETRETFGARLAGGEGPFLRTGDLGLVAGGELFVTGRLKEVMIVRGRNHYPQDVERTAEGSHPALRPGSGAAFLVDGGGGERLVVAHEVRPAFVKTLSVRDMARQVREAVARERPARERARPAPHRRPAPHVERQDPAPAMPRRGTWRGHSAS